MKAIQVKYLSPTDTKGSRVKAFCEAGQVTLHMDYEGSYETNMEKAVLQLLGNLGWQGTWHGGCIEDGSLHVFVCSDWDTELRAVAHPYRFNNAA